MIPTMKYRGPPEVKNYKKRRARFLQLHGSSGWENVAASMRRFAVAWENPFPADTLADIVAALEHIMVRETTEVSYKVRLRTAHYLSESVSTRKTIFRDLRDAYAYRSKIAHGAYVFDDPREYAAAVKMKGAKGKAGNPFHDVNQIHRLTGAVSGYYREALERMIDRGVFDIDWASRAL